MIKLVRVDHRLLHGQVAFSWTNSLNANCILVASDKVVNDEIWKTTLKLGKPNGSKLVIKNINDSIEAINSGVTDKYNLIVVVSNIDDAYLLAKACKEIRSINLGGTKNIENYTQIGKQIFVSQDQINKINELIELGIEVEIRQLANETKQILNKM
ncbi:MAG: PTS sugar transporter subunit IIB [Erysipelotrichaceae bacterium]|nr:PTS sugar transporter subunit IIB [Erysipelotrichaceae bacterium]